MTLSRAPHVMSEKLRKIITRDTIIFVSIIAPLASIFDIVLEPQLLGHEKIMAYTLLVIFTLTGVLRLRKNSLLYRKPVVAIVVYQVILAVVIAYLSEVSSYYPFMWLVPIFLSSFYYGRRAALYSYLMLVVVQIVKIVYYGSAGYITDREGYLYLVAELLMIGSLSLLIVDTISITEEDRVIANASLEKAETEQEKLNALINSIRDGVVAVDANFSIVRYNAAALSILDTQKEILGSDFRQLCYVQTTSGEPVDLGSVLLMKSSDTECVITYADGQKAVLLLSALPIRIKSTQQDKGTVFILRDVTKQKTLEEERNAFVSLMSHELRTPLAIAEANVSNAQLLIKKGDYEKVSSALKEVSNQVGHLTQITNEFSLVIDASQPSTLLQKEDISVSEILVALDSQFRERAEAKGISFACIIAPDMADTVKSSKEYLTHILACFTDNAIKFTEKGSIAVEVTRTQAGVEFCVQDTGRGIAKADHEKVFSPFYQSDDYETRAQGGLGVGLYTAKKLAEIIGGKVVFTSEKDRGSVFTLRLPL